MVNNCELCAHWHGVGNMHKPECPERAKSVCSTPRGPTSRSITRYCLVLVAVAVVW